VTQTLEERIRDLYAVQSHAIDYGNARKWAETFTLDGVFESYASEVRLRGRKQLEAFAATYQNPEKQFQHWISNSLIEHSANNGLRVASYIALYMTDNLLNETRVLRMGRIVDDLVETNGFLLVKRRAVTVP